MSESKYGFNYGFSTFIGIDDIGFVDGSRGKQYKVALDIKDEHVNGHGTLHGGVVATLLDACMARVFFLSLPGQNPDNPIGGVTVEMKTTYLRGVNKGHVYALGTLLKQGKRVAFTEGELYSKDGELLATASATMMLTARKDDS
jgi:uncharacterized protein (TIGR00369 family)